MSTKKILNHTEVAKYLGVSRATLYEMIEDGRFPVKSITGTEPKLYSMEKVREWTNS